MRFLLYVVAVVSLVRFFLYVVVVVSYARFLLCAVAVGLFCAAVLYIVTMCRRLGFDPTFLCFALLHCPSGVVHFLTNTHHLCTLGGVTRYHITSKILAV